MSSLHERCLQFTFANHKRQQNSTRHMCITDTCMQDSKIKILKFMKSRNHGDNIHHWFFDTVCDNYL